MPDSYDRFVWCLGGICVSLLGFEAGRQDCVDVGVP